MASKLYAIEQTQSQGQCRVDGVGRPKFDFHTGPKKPKKIAEDMCRNESTFHVYNCQCGDLYNARERLGV